MSDADVQSAVGMIRESARGLVKAGDLGRIRKLRHSKPGFDRNVWTEICAMGWPALRVPEDKGGVDLGMLAYCALAEELGRGLVPEPLIPAILAAAWLEGDALEKHLSGESLTLPAWQDARDTIAPERALTIRGGRLTATKRYVAMAMGADAFVVAGSSAAFLLRAAAAGVSTTASETQDGGHIATITFDEASGVQRAIDPAPALAEASLASAAYLLGLMDAGLEITVAYLKTRTQFGKRIGSFQILQHMAVDLKLEVELTRASVEDAARQWDQDAASVDAYCAVSRAKARASQSALKVTRDCIQLHGGIGFTDEHDIGLFLRKAIVVASQFGGVAAHRAQYLRLRPIQQEA